MKKRLFFGFAFFIGFFMLVAWQFAAAELAELQSKGQSNMQNQSTELAASSSEEFLFV